MATSGSKFLHTVLGPEGARALERAAKRSSALGTALLPRAVMAWLCTVDRTKLETELPGLPGSSFVLLKSGDAGYTGAIVDTEGHTISFEHQNLLHVAAALTVALDPDTQRLDPELQDVDLARLGKSVSLIIGSRAARKGIVAIAAATPKVSLMTDNAETGSVSVLLTKTAAMTVCDVCGLRQSATGYKLKFCQCLRDLSKTCKVEEQATGWVLTFDNRFDAESLEEYLKDQERNLGDSNG